MDDEEEEARIGFLLDMECTGKLIQMAYDDSQTPYEVVVKLICGAYRYQYEIPREQWSQ